MTLLVIIGMHRSGTSLLARACHEAGIFGGGPEEMLESQADNPLGFYERSDLVAANEALLTANETRWYEPPECALTSAGDDLSPLCEAVYSRLRLARRDRDAFIKDPRLCLTWPVWRSLTAVDRQIVIYVYRDPLSVARSLQSRHGFPLAFGLSLWEHYNRLALAALRDSEFLCISYAQMASDPQALTGLLAKLQTRGVQCNPGAGAALFNPDLQHSHAASQVGGRLQSFEQTLLAEYCDALCAGGPLLPLPAPTPSLYEKIRDFAGALAPLSDARETRQRLDEARELSDERTAERDRMLAEWKQLETSHQTLAAAHKREVANHEHTVAQRDALNEQHNALIADHQAKQAELGALNNELAALKNESADLKNQLAELTDKTNYLFHELSQTYTFLLQYELSTLGRVTRWVARTYKMFTGQGRENSRYDDVLANARQHMSDNALELPVGRPGKLAMLGDVLRYLASNPVGSLRSISWPRLRRGFSVFFGSSAADLQVWIDARFPEQATARLALDPADLSPGLDNLELTFPDAAYPRVSIVVPVYNDYRVTVHCLQSLLRHTAAEQYEVILADDGSNDLTASIESRLSGIRVVRGGNLGFLRNCNRAAEHARGEFIVLLNNDTAVTEGWLQALLKVFEQPSVGAAGPKLLFADGTLQESGGIMWRDGSAWNFGRMDESTKPSFNYVKDVDYISGACLMLRRALWQQLGGFDERFAPAYYEDADLCFAVRQAGYRVIYQPASAVFHFEGVSNGRDLTAGVKQHQVANQRVFADKWRSLLERDHFANADHVTWARDRSARKPCVLFIDHYVPHYDKDAGSRSTFMYVKLMLNMGYRVQFMGANFFAHAPYTQDLQQLGVEVLVGESLARGLDGWLSEHAPYINQIFLHRPHVAEQFLPHLQKLPVCPPINFVGHDLHYLRIGREAELLSDAALMRRAESWRKREYAVFEQVDRIYYFSRAETDEIARHRPDLTLRTIPLHVLDILALPLYAPSRPKHLLFVGGFNHPPNVDAARWFVHDILPIVTHAVPDCHLHLVGSNPSSAVEELAGDNVTVHGYVSDAALENLYREVGLAIVPLRYGAGVKGKVLEAVQHNVPLVTTTIGAEGIPEADAVMWIADEAEAIAVAVIGILDGSVDPTERMALYSDWLQKHFSCHRAEALLRQDFET